MSKIILIIGSLLFFASLIHAESLTKYEEGNKLYTDGKYEEALAAYQEVISEGYESAELYYNMGNAAYKSMQYTYSILYYEKALRLAPKDEDITANLELVRKYHVTDDIKVLPEIFINKWIRDFRKSVSTDSWAYLSVICFILFLSFLGIYLFSTQRSLKKTGFAAGIVVLTISAFAFKFSLKSRNEILAHKEAIIFTPSVIIKSSPDTNGKELFNLHEGTKVSIQDSTDNYFEIKIADGNVGWLLRTDVKRI